MGSKKSGNRTHKRKKTGWHKSNKTLFVKRNEPIDGKEYMRMFHQGSLS